MDYNNLLGFFLLMVYIYNKLVNFYLYLNIYKGELDPYHTGGVLKTLSPSIIAHIIPN